MNKRPKNKKIEIICPNCKEERTEKSLSYLFKWRKQYNLPNLGVKENYEIDDEERLRWACDICIKSNKIILARPEIQDYSFHPYFVYLDIDRKCNTCNRDYIYTKEEQQFWYEELGKNYWSRANNCLECRLEKRDGNSENNRLSRLIANLDENSIESLKKVIETYLEMQKVDKAKFYMSKLRKLSKKNGFDYSSIERKINNT